MPIRLVFAASLLLGISASHAAVYQCSAANGSIEFRDKPCAPGSGGEIAVKGVTPARTSDPEPADGDSNSGRTLSTTSLTGRWCEYAVSMDRNGEQDTSAPANWTFNSDTVEYAQRGAAGTLKSALVRKGDGFAVENSMMGGPDKTWTLVAFSAGRAVIHGPFGGYYHFRSGSCS